LKSNNITYARIGGAWRPTIAIGNRVAQAHWLSTTTTTINAIIEHTPNTTLIESMSTITITTTTMPRITTKTTTIMPTINVCFHTYISFFLPNLCM
jgi:hypothetical protein